jgi:DNA-directed RNA polymerase subunit RPC12/RpoP
VVEKMTVLERLKNLRTHPFWNDVSTRTVAGVLVAAIVGLALAIFTPIVAWLRQDVVTVRWWYWLSLLGLFALVCYEIYRLRRQHSVPRSSYLSYTEELISNIWWRWEWPKSGAPKEGEPYKILACCPNCSLQLYVKRKPETLRSIQAGDAGEKYYCCTTCKMKFPFFPIEEAKKIILTKKQQRWPS